ncbi:TRAP transporter large permease subunit [Chloroflexota bacterium]
MEWQLTLLVILGSLLVLMMTGLPIALCFLFVDLIGVFIFFGGTAGLEQLILSLLQSLNRFSLVPLPLFILMGEVMFLSGIAPLMMDAMDGWLGRLPGRLSLEAVAGGTLFATLSGASMASVAMLGSVLVPEMEKRGYKKPMTLGPILGSGGLAIMIPPSALAILLGALGEISIGKLLIAIIIPGLIMATLYAIYIVGRCFLQPHLAPAYVVTHISISEKIVATLKNILPLGLIIFLVLGVIFLGVATPTEAAATGALGTFILAACHRRLNWKTIKDSFMNTIDVTIMMFMIIVGATAYAQILGFTGASRGLVDFVIGLPLVPILVIIAMQVLLLFLGMFISVVAIMMITLPIFLPVVIALGFDPIWFGVIFLLNIEMATTSPPYGLSLFVMKGVVPPDTTMGDIYRAALPFLYCDLVAMVCLIAFPSLVLWLPGLMR